jgi:hypothetical protein
MESKFDLNQLLTIWKTTFNSESRISGLFTSVDLHNHQPQLIKIVYPYKG